MDSVGATPQSKKKKYLFSVDKLHENVLVKRKSKSNLDKIELLQIYAKRRRPVIYNIPSSRDSQVIYYIFMRARGFRTSPSLEYKFEFYSTQRLAIKAMRRKTRKLIKKSEFVFVENPSFLNIRAFEKMTTGLGGDLEENQLARAYAPTADVLAADVFNAMSPSDLSNGKTRKENHMIIL